MNNNRDYLHKQYRQAAKEFQRLFWKIEDTSGLITNKDYLSIIIIQQQEILERLRE